MTNESDSSCDAIDNAHEKGYIEGRNAAYRHALIHLARELGIFSKEDPAVQLVHMIDERARAVKSLRDMCETLGCNDWLDALDLGDVLNKHVLPALELAQSEPQQTHIDPNPPILQLRASTHVAMRAWLEAEFGADELHEQRIVDAMRAIREQIEAPTPARPITFTVLKPGHGEW